MFCQQGHMRWSVKSPLSAPLGILICLRGSLVRFAHAIWCDVVEKGISSSEYAWARNVRILMRRAYTFPFAMSLCRKRRRSLWVKEILFLSDVTSKENTKNIKEFRKRDTHKTPKALGEEFSEFWSYAICVAWMATQEIKLSSSRIQ